MCAIECINKEIEEGYSQINNQHEHIKHYLHVYLLALGGLFVLTGYFVNSYGGDGNNGMDPVHAAIGLVAVFVVFILGWVFLSIVGYKISMTTMLYKHIASARDLRLTLIPNFPNYVLPTKPNDITLPTLTDYMPILVCSFNFLMLVGGSAYFILELCNKDYAKAVCIINSIFIIFGSVFPIACINLKEKIECAKYANNVAELNLYKHLWSAESRRHKNNFFHSHKKIILILCTIASLLFTSFVCSNDTESMPKSYIIFISWFFIISFTVLRIMFEKAEYSQKLATQH